MVETLKKKLENGKVIICFPYGFYHKYIKKRKHNIKGFFDEHFTPIEKEIVSCPDIKMEIFNDGYGIFSVEGCNYTNLKLNIMKAYPIDYDECNLDLYTIINKNDWRRYLMECCQENSYWNENYDLIKDSKVDDGVNIPACLEYFIS
jgi:hypothetical protein